MARVTKGNSGNAYHKGKRSVVGVWGATIGWQAREPEQRRKGAGTTYRRRSSPSAAVWVPQARCSKRCGARSWRRFGRRRMRWPWRVCQSACVGFLRTTTARPAGSTPYPYTHDRTVTNAGSKRSVEPVWSRRWLPPEAGGGEEPRPPEPALPARLDRRKPIAPQHIQRPPTVRFGAIGHLHAPCSAPWIQAPSDPTWPPHTGTTERLPLVTVRSCRYEGRAYRLRMALQFRRSGRSQMSFLGLS